MQVYTYNSFGYDGGLVRVEVDVRPGLPVIDIVGLAGAAVREAKERIRVALRLSGFEFPHGHILVNLAPAGMPKSGASYDLPIAYAILSKAGVIEESATPILVMGELTLDGSVSRVDCILPALIEAKASGIESALLPMENRLEADLLRLNRVRFANTLREAVASTDIAFTHNSERQTTKLPTISNRKRYSGSSAYTQQGEESGAGSNVPGSYVHGISPLPFDTAVFDDHPLLGLSMICAAAGGHHILFYGPPGSGKTMALRFLGELLPSLADHELLEVNRLYSSAGMLGPETGVVTKAPVRMPHHSASVEAMVGGGKLCRPGEISLAHRGLLILDEAPEFKPGNLQALREPLEDRRIRISRADYQVWYPADFTLGMALNSCPCGRLGSASGTCICKPQEVRRYWNRIGGPLLDRIDLRVSIGDTMAEERYRAAKPLVAEYCRLLDLSAHNWSDRARRLIGLVHLSARSNDAAGPNGGSLPIGKLLCTDIPDTRNRRASHAIRHIAATLHALLLASLGEKEPGDVSNSQNYADLCFRLATELRKAIAPLPGFEIQE